MISLFFSFLRESANTFFWRRKRHVCVCVCVFPCVHAISSVARDYSWMNTQGLFWLYTGEPAVPAIKCGAPICKACSPALCIFQGKDILMLTSNLEFISYFKAHNILNVIVDDIQLSVLSYINSLFAVRWKLFILQIKWLRLS